MVKKEVASVLKKEHLNLTTGEAPLYCCSRGSDVTAILCYMAKYQHFLHSLKSDLSKFTFLLLCFLAEEPEKVPKDTKKLPVLTKKHVHVTKPGEFLLTHSYNCGN